MGRELGGEDAFHDGVLDLVPVLPDQAPTVAAHPRGILGAADVADRLGLGQARELGGLEGMLAVGYQVPPKVNGCFEKFENGPKGSAWTS